MSDYRVSYAQNREDIILTGFFKGLEKGFYVDVGANHPDTLSITKIFYDAGWNGINLEPNKELYDLIVAARPRDLNLNIGAADRRGKLVLRQYPDGDGLSTFSKDAQTDYQRTTSEYKNYTDNYQDYTVQVKPLKDILNEINVGTINFMNIDVEGFEYQVIAGNDWEKYRPQVLCIEANHIVNDWRPLLKNAMYDLVFFDGLNNYYVAHEHPEIAQNFSYVNTLLLGKPVIPAHIDATVKNLQEYLGRKDNEISELENRLLRQRLVEEGLRSELHSVYLQLAMSKRLRTVIKQLVISSNTIILIWIEKLNHPKLKKQLPIQINKTMSSNEMHGSIRRYDIERYYDSQMAHPMLYKILFVSYTGLYADCKAGTRCVIRLLRGDKNV
jgi:FkbM family methyltransferase